ncbi:MULTISPECIES: NAD-dependent epimerase/dehydratase family protein [Thiorhodovibrio]|uniref:NAD-dependent epimerase/dehydratase family protein n=1 Tax=Thiorhodovibrio TaxID=61593 RepID=UPI0019118B26|nr:NAD-dependent epimerase/dehydratase family protein [Thiorhodovibrio litoralis]MBK5968673.1 hypothetical protein [Thiorhodovibrio winogradskyi]WPL10969.1 Cholesterol dehydrogenase [Thiorhodovibrio litoralis]
MDRDRLTTDTAASVLVTGATGFVGNALCPYLSERGWTVIAGLRTAGVLPPGAVADRLLGDLAQAPRLAEALAGIDSIVHLAGRAHVMREHSNNPERAFFAANVQATENLANAAVQAGVRRLVFISSIKVNGESTDGRPPFRASDTPSPEDAYGRSKLAAEQALQRIAGRTGLQVVIIRPPLLHGPGVKGNLLRLLRLIERGIPLPLGAIENQRSLLAVENLCDLINHCLHHPAASGETLLAADSSPLSTPELIDALASGMKKPARLLPIPVALLNALATISGRQATLQRLAGSLLIDTQQSCQRIAWTPPIETKTGLRQTAAWYLANRL